MNKSSQLLVYVAGAVALGTSIYLLATGERHSGVFMGLWAPTFFALGAFFASSTNKQPSLVRAPIRHAGARPSW
jgi:hypothetical protein